MGFAEQPCEMWNWKTIAELETFRKTNEVEHTTVIAQVVCLFGRPLGEFIYSTCRVCKRGSVVGLNNICWRSKIKLGHLPVKCNCNVGVEKE